jgi:hypothetical protein
MTPAESSTAEELGYPKSSFPQAAFAVYNRRVGVPAVKEVIPEVHEKLESA